MSLAVQYVENSGAEVLANVIEKMNNNSEFFGNVINSKNLEELLKNEGFILSAEALNILSNSTKKIKEMVNNEVKTMTTELYEIVIKNQWGCNGTGW